MDTPERSSRSHAKRWDAEDASDRKSDMAGEDEEWEGSEKRKHRSSRSRKLGTNGEDAQGLDADSRRRGSFGERGGSSSSDGRKRSGADGWSTRVDSDDDDYESRKELRSKQMKKKPEESSLEQLSTWYQDGELENRQGGVDKSGGSSRGHGWVDENERRKMMSKVPEHDSSHSGNRSKEERSPSRRRVMSKVSEQESSQTGNKSKEERFHDVDHERTADRDSSKYAERKDSSRDKGHNSVEMGRSSRRRWDESDNLAVTEDNLREIPDSRSRKDSDFKYDNSRERDASSRIQEPSDGQDSVFYSSGGKRVKTVEKDDKRVDMDRTKSKGRTEAAEEDSRGSSVAREDRLGRDKNQKHRAQKNTIAGDGPEGRERYSNADEDDSTWMRNRTAREVGLSNQSKSPERSVRCYQQPQHSEVESERGADVRRKDIEKDGYREDKGKGRDAKWSDGNRDWENSQENWKRRPPAGNDRELKDGDIFYDRGKDWEPRHVRERNDNERPHGRSRGEAVKTSSNFGISHDDYDVIEIQTKPLDYGRVDSGSNFGKRTGFGEPFDAKSAPSEDWAYTREERARRHDTYVSAPSVEASKRYLDNGVMEDPRMWRDDIDNQGGKGRGQRGAATGRSSDGPSSSGGSLSPYGNQEPGYFGRPLHQGVKGNRGGRGGRGRLGGRDSQPVGLPLPIMGSPFGPVAMPPPGPLQPLVTGMSPAPGPPISPGVFIPPFSPPLVWPGARGVEMNMLSVPPALPPVPSGPSGPRFPPSIGTPPSNPTMFFNQPEPGPGRGVPPNIPGPGFNVAGPAGRGTPTDKAQGGWVPPRSNGPPGKAPSRGEQNDYSQNFVDTGMRPQNFIRELELTHVVEDYPKLRDLIQKKDEIVAKSSSPPMYLKTDLKEFELSPEFFGTKFDVILVDPPWEEYVHRAPGVADHMEYWTFEEILSLKIEGIADTPSFIFLWVGDGVGLEQGRQCLKKWGFRRCEDICWVKTNKNNATPGLRHDSHTLFQHSKEHCLMGIKGTVRRSTDGHIIHANIDTDVIIAEEPPYGSTQKPEDMYRIIEHFALGRRRLELFGEDHNIRSGWLTVGKELSSTNFNSEAYIRNFADKDGKVWQGGGGRNPPPEAPHLVVTTPEIEALRPKSPMKNQQQIQQQQSTSISLTTANSSNRRPSGNSPQNPSAFSLNQEAPSANLTTLTPWASPMDSYRHESGNLPLGGHDF